MAVVFIEHLALLRRGALESLVDNPRAFVVLDVGANLSDCFWGAVCVEIVVLDLKVFAQRDEDVARLAEVAVRGELKEVEGESDGEIEAVVGGFVDDDEGVFAQREFAQVDVVLGGCEQVGQLAHFGLEGDGVEELDEVEVGRVRAEMLCEEDVDG